MHAGGRVFRKERLGGFARPLVVEHFGGRESRGRCAHSGNGVFWRERARGAVRTDGGKSADCAQEAVQGLPRAVTDCTAVDASSVRARLSHSVLAFLRRPQVPPPNPHSCPPSLERRGFFGSSREEEKSDIVGMCVCDVRIEVGDF